MITLKGKEIELTVATPVPEVNYPDLKYTKGMTGVLLTINPNGSCLIALKINPEKNPTIILTYFWTRHFTFTGNTIELELSEYSTYLEGKETADLTVQTTRSIKLGEETCTQ